jgi:hypothetical protein
LIQLSILIAPVLLGEQNALVSSESFVMGINSKQLSLTLGLMACGTPFK